MKRKHLFIFSLIIAAVFASVSLSACDNESSGGGGGYVIYDSSNVSDIIDNGAMTIERFSTRTGKTPTLTKTNVEEFNNTVSVQQLQSYADYLASRGYKENKTLEKEYASDYDRIWLYEGDTEKEFVNILYSAGVANIGYGSECKFSSGGSGDSGGSDQSVASSPDSKKCTLCGGTGKTACTSCKGSGYITQTKNAPDYGYGTNSYEISKKCPRCSGKGEINCKGCNGTGKMK